MIGFRPLPWEYGVRNLLRRPLRSGLTLLALALVVVLVLTVVGFVRGLERNLQVSGDPDVVIVHSLGAGEFLETSSVPAGMADELGASLKAVRKRFRTAYTSPELFLGTQMTVDGDTSLGLIRGVTPPILLVRRTVQLESGRWPELGEVLVGRLAAAKLGMTEDMLRLGTQVTFEGRTWRVAGTFSARGSTLESELWCRLDELQQVLKRNKDLTLAALVLDAGADFADVDEFCKERVASDELEATPEQSYYAAIERHYRPVRLLGWLLTAILAGAGIFAGLNAMYGSVAGRVRELATLQALGFSRRAVALSLIQEGALLAAAACLLGAAFAVLVLDGQAVRFTMGAFTLLVDGTTLAIGCGVGLGIGVLGALPPAWRALRLELADGLKAV